MNRVQARPTALTAAVLQLRRDPQDEGAWRVLYVELQPLFARIARRTFLADDARVDEAVQKTFRDLFTRNAAALVDVPEHFTAYAARACVNSVRELLREDATSERWLSLDSLTDEQLVLRPRLGNDEEAMEIALEALLGRLPPGDRQILRLVMTGSTYQDIAAALGVSDAAGAVRVTRLKAKIAKLLDDNAL